MLRAWSKQGYSTVPIIDRGRHLFLQAGRREHVFTRVVRQEKTYGLWYSEPTLHSFTNTPQTHARLGPTNCAVTPTKTRAFCRRREREHLVVQRPLPSQTSHCANQRALKVSNNGYPQLSDTCPTAYGHEQHNTDLRYFQAAPAITA